MAPSSEPRVYTEQELDHIVAKRIAEKQKAEQEEHWVATVNATIEAINRHVGADGAHPRLLDLVGRAVQATERMERMLVTAAPDDVARYLPLVIEREKKEAEEREERRAEIKQIRNLIIVGIPTISAVATIVQVLLHFWGH